MDKLLKNEKVVGISYLLFLISVWAVSIMVAYPDFRRAFSGSIPAEDFVGVFLLLALKVVIGVFATFFLLFSYLRQLNMIDRYRQGEARLEQSPGE